MNELLCRGSGLMKATPRHCTEATHPQLSRVAPSKIHFRVRRLTSAAHALVAAPLRDYAPLGRHVARVWLTYWSRGIHPL